MTRSTGTSISVTVYKLATGQFAEVPYPTARPQDERHTSTQNFHPPPLEDIPRAPVRQGTPWPNTVSASEKLSETRKDWLIPPIPVPTPIMKTESPPKIAVIPQVMVTPKQVTEKCSWGPHCPICKNEDKYEEDREGKRQSEQPRMCPKTHNRPSHKALSSPSYSISLTDTLNRFD